MPDKLAQFARNCRDERELFVRLWLAEGIPYAFQEFPLLFQKSREWLANRIKVSTRDISVVGSAKIGYTLKPTNGTRPAFTGSSDIDYVIVSKPLFDRCAEDSMRFADDMNTGRIKPVTPAEKKWWPQDVDFITRNVPHGFVNSGKVPNQDRYGATQDMERAFWSLTVRLKATKDCPAFTKATYRVYETHDAFIQQATINLGTAMLGSL